MRPFRRPPAGFSFPELVVVIILTSVVLALAFGIWRWFQRGSRETLTRDACGTEMRLLHETLRTDIVSASGWTLEGERTLTLEGVVDSQGRPLPPVIYHFDPEKRTVTREDGTSPHQFGFGEATRGMTSFTFLVELLDESRTRNVPASQAHVLQVGIRMEGPGVPPQEFSFAVARASRYSPEVSSTDLLWKGP